jgi:hypothetical protein
MVAVAPSASRGARGRLTTTRPRVPSAINARVRGMPGMTPPGHYRMMVSHEYSTYGDPGRARPCGPEEHQAREPPREAKDEHEKGCQSLPHCARFLRGCGRVVIISVFSVHCWGPCMRHWSRQEDIVEETCHDG